MGYTSGTKYCGRRTHSVYCFCFTHSLASEETKANTDQLILGVVHAKKQELKLTKNQALVFNALTRQLSQLAHTIYLMNSENTVLKPFADLSSFGSPY